MDACAQLGEGSLTTGAAAIGIVPEHAGTLVVEDVLAGGVGDVPGRR